MLHDEPRPRKRRRPPARRKTVRWSAREVDALLAGVRFHGVGKWAAILRHSKVFNGVRTSVDLKDKWRNLTSPVRAAALAACPSPSAPEELASSLHNPSLTSPPFSPARSPSPDPVPVQEHQPQSPDQSNSDQLSLAESQQHPPARDEIIDDQPEHKSRSHCDSLPQSQLHIPELSMSKSKTQSQSLSFPSLQPDLGMQTDPATLPPPPSESSVSPEVLSVPSGQLPSQAAQSTTTPFPLSSQLPPPHLYPHHNPAYASMNANHSRVATMQQVYGQSLYQSAAALAAYWRRLGHEPNPYAIAAALTSSSSSPQMNPCLIGPSAPGMFTGVDDDDDDDDDDDAIPTTMPIYPLSFSPMFHKDTAHLPLNRMFSQGLTIPTGHTDAAAPAVVPVAPVDGRLEPLPTSAPLQTKQGACSESNGKCISSRTEANVPLKVEPEGMQSPPPAVINDEGNHENIVPDEASKYEACAVDTDSIQEVEDGQNLEATSGLEYLNVDEIPEKDEKSTDGVEIEVCGDYDKAGSESADIAPSFPAEVSEVGQDDRRLANLLA